VSALGRSRCCVAALPAMAALYGVIASEVKQTR